MEIEIHGFIESPFIEIESILIPISILVKSTRGRERCRCTIPTTEIRLIHMRVREEILTLVIHMVGGSILVIRMVVILGIPVVHAIHVILGILSIPPLGPTILSILIIEMPGIHATHMLPILIHLHFHLQLHLMHHTMMNTKETMRLYALH